jgi:hypothetical protein
MANTMTLISSVTVGAGGASSIDFSSIPATYTDLCLKISGRTNRSLSVDGIALRFNNDLTSGNYTGIRFYGDGSAAGTDSGSATWDGMPFMDAATSTASVFGNAEVYIPNYTGSTQKSISVDGVAENNATTVYMGLGAGKWSGTSAINRITIYGQSAGATILQYSTAYLYGVKNA